ncbi:hypothetical protein ACQKCU_20380 [Heyndrickxia sporothermodurans]
MKKIPSLWIGIIGCSILAVFFFLGPYLPMVDGKVTKHPFIMINNNKDIIIPPFAPSYEFPLGTDHQGRDMLSALIVGTRETLLTVGIISCLTFLIGIPLGVAASHIEFIRMILQGWNYFFSRLPVFFYLVILVTIPVFIFSPNRPKWMILFLILLEMGKIADFVMKSVQVIQKTTYYEAAVISGTKIFGFWKWYYLPGCLPSWLSYFIQHMGSILFLLGQLGIFNIFISQTLIQEGSPAYSIENTSLIWPMFLSNVYVDAHVAPWQLFSSSLFITFAILSFIALGDGLLKYSLQVQRGYKVPGQGLWKFIKVKKIENRVS